MHDFDEARRERQAARPADDRQFTLGGVTFTYRKDVPFRVIQRVTEIALDTSGSTVIRTLEEALLACLEDGQAARWEDAVNNPDMPGTLQDLNDGPTGLIG